MLLLYVTAVSLLSTASAGLFKRVPPPRHPIEPPTEPTQPPKLGYTYSVVFPRSIRKGEDLDLFIEFKEPVFNELIHVVLTGRWSNKNASYAEVIKQLTGGVKTAKVSLPIPTDIDWRARQINITGTGDVPFKNNTYVNLSYKSKSIWIQTDKAMYKPGQTVKYNVFVTDSGLNPLNLPVTIEIYDPNNNKIIERNNERNWYGLSGTLKLSDNPVQGYWRLKVEIEGEKVEESMSFEVAEYVLPKFEVTVELPPFGTKDDVELKGKVKAAYTFGQPVQGLLKLSVAKRYSYGFYDPRSISTEMQIDGQAEFNISREHLGRLIRSLEHEETVVVTARVTETLTGITLDGSAEMKYYPKAYKLEFFPNMANNFKPGFPYTAVIKVTQQDGRPLVNPTQTLKITKTCFTEVSLNATTLPPAVVLDSPFLLGETIAYDPIEYQLTENGVVSFPVEIHELAATCSIKAEFGGETKYKDISRFRSPTDAYLRVEMLTEKAKAGQDANFQLTSNIRPGIVSYFIQSKGLIADAGQVSVDVADLGHVFTIRMRKEFAPSARMVAYFIKPDGEIVADGLNFGLEDLFENKVSIEFAQKDTVKPNDQASLTVRAEPNSLVNVLVVDKSVRLLKSGNEITQDKVRDELLEYGNDRPWLRGWDWTIPYPVNADDSCDIFDNARLAVLSDASCFRFNLWNQPRRQISRSSRLMSKSSFGAAPMARMAMADDAGMMESAGAGGGSGAQEPVRIRKDFPEAWIWKNATAEPGPQALALSSARGKSAQQESLFAADGAPASSVGSGARQVEEPVRIRKDFPESWIWKNATADANGMVFLDDVVPDTITEWVAGAFAISTTKGLGVAPDPAKLVVFKDFFVSLNLPYSIVRNEVAVIQANVFNYLPTDVYARVTLSGTHEFASVITDGINEREEYGNQERCVKVQANRPAPVYFTIRPTIIGNVQLTVTVRAGSKADAVERMLPVKAEGEPKSYSIPVLLSLKEPGAVVQKTESITYPPDMVLGSARTRVSLFDNVFGPSIEGLDGLVRMPYGCGEQNMLNFGPAVYAADYLTEVGAYDTQLKQKIENVLLTGYQRELIYQRNDGSFSAFGNADPAGSLWLTAFVAKVFSQSKRFIYIDPKVVDRAVNFIIEKQTDEGFFNDPGTLHHGSMSGASRNSNVSMAAYVLIALQEVQNAEILKSARTIRSLKNASDKAESYIKQQIPDMSTDYSFAISAYAMKLTGNEIEAGILLAKLESSVSLNTHNNTVKYWKNKSKSLEVEIAAYAMLAYITPSKPGAIVDTDTGLKIFKWLVDQRNSYGGFISTQDTVTALQSFSAMAKLVYEPVYDMKVYVTAAGQTQTITMNNANSDVYQFIDFQGDITSVGIQATGSGFGVVQIGVFYNVEKDPEPDSYTLTLVPTPDEADTERFTLQACTSWVVTDRVSGMVIMDIGAPSGYVLDHSAIEKAFPIKLVESEGGRVIIYFERLTDEHTCVTLPAQRVNIVNKVQSAFVKVYSYYDPEDFVSRSYLPPGSQTETLCDVCGDKCGCGLTAEPLPLDMCAGNVVGGRGKRRGKGRKRSSA